MDCNSKIIIFRFSRPRAGGAIKGHKRRFVPFDCLHTKSKEGDTNTMENENGAVITLIILVVFAFLLLVAKFTEFIVRFNQETKCITEQIIFPEINIDNVSKMQGMNITFVTTAKTDEEGYALLKEFGLPFNNAK